MTIPLPPFPEGPCKSGESREALIRYLRAIEARRQAAFDEEMARREAEEPPDPTPGWELDAKETYYE